jgi:hypothetical protein
MSEEVKLLPCPFCGSIPDVSNPDTFATINTSKYGAVMCCITGPEVRTSYMSLEHWRGDAIAAWNRRPTHPESAVSGEWVPVSERLPTHDGYYEVTSSEPYPPAVYVLKFRDAAYEHGHWCADGDWHGYVIAWRELPPPYQRIGEG